MDLHPPQRVVEKGSAFATETAISSSCLQG